MQVYLNCLARLTGHILFTVEMKADLIKRINLTRRQNLSKHGVYNVARDKALLEYTCMKHKLKSYLRLQFHFEFQY